MKQNPYESPQEEGSPLKRPSRWRWPILVALFSVGVVIAVVGVCTYVTLGQVR